MILNKIKINGGGNMLIYLAKIKTKPMGIEENFNAADREIKKAIAANADIVILPCAFLTGYNIGILAGAGYAEKRQAKSRYTDFGRRNV